MKMSFKSIVLFAALITVALALWGCGGESGQQKESVDLSQYESIEPGSMVIVYSDGTADEFGIEEGYQTVTEEFDKNAAAAKAKYEGATLVVKAPITIIGDAGLHSNPPGNPWIGFGATAWNMTMTEVEWPMIFIFNCENDILNMGVGDVVFAAGPLEFATNGSNRDFVLNEYYRLEKVA